MKSLIKTLAVAVILAASVATFAQSNSPSAESQTSGYSTQMQNANTATTQPNTSGYGTAVNGTSQAGYRAETRASSYSPPVYIAH